MVPQFGTCGKKIYPEFIHNFLPRIDVYIFPSCGFRCLAFLELSTGSVQCAPDEIDRPSVQIDVAFFFFLLSIYAVFLILFLVSSLKYVRKIFNIYLTLK